MKNKIKAGEFIVIGDYSENYSFVTHDAIQACHWNNARATIHPFVIYNKNLDDDELGHFCFSIISDHLIHDTSGVYLFQKKLISLLKEKFHEVVKCYYFSSSVTLIVSILHRQTSALIKKFECFNLFLCLCESKSCPSSTVSCSD